MPSPARLSVPPRLLAALLGALAVVMAASAVVELAQSRRELRALMTTQAHTLLESLLAASANALDASTAAEDALRRRLLDNAAYVRERYEAGTLTDATLARWAEAHDLHRIRVLGPDGAIRYGSHPFEHPEALPIEERQALLDPIFSGEADTLALGLRTARAEPGTRYAVALAAADRSAIVVNLDVAEPLRFRRSVGFGPLLRRVAEGEGVVYAALQDSTGLLAAAGAVEALEPFGASAFLQTLWARTVAAGTTEPVARMVPAGEGEVLEVVHPFVYHDALVGLFRLGLSTAPLQALDAHIVRRLVLITLLLVGVGFGLVALLVTRQHAEALEKQVAAVETFSRRVVEHVSDGIVVADARGVRALNAAAEELFDVAEADVRGRPLAALLPGPEAERFLRSPARQERLRVSVGGRERHLLVARSAFTDEHGARTTVLIVRDLTRQQALEAEVRRRERLTAMGEAAGGFAHEIRNPLNAVGAIVQQLRTDFTPAEGADEYRELTALVYREVRRINEAVHQFLQMVRPPPLRPAPFAVGALVRDVERAMAPLAAEHGARLDMQVGAGVDGEEVWWDRAQIQQALTNLIQNAIEATGAGGHVRLAVERPEPGAVEARICDDGPGIPDAVRLRIFDLYYTTKPAGTGVGLSLVHRIVSDHGGLLDVETAAGAGTTFTLRLPAEVMRDA